MARQATIKAVLTLNNVPFLNGMKKAADAAKALARQFAKSPIQTSFLAGMVGARKAISGVSAGVEKFASTAKAGFGVAVAGGAALVGTMTLISKAAIDAAAEYEQFGVTFEVMLGSAQKATQRMADLAKFANTTPFDLPEVARASTVLETLTKGALSTGKGLALVGDVAAGTNTKFEETAVTVGRLFDAIRSGRTAGESLMRLQEIGAIGGADRGKIEGLITAGRTAEAWQTAQAALMRFNGLMEKKAKTWSGMMSTFGDSVKESMRQFGTPLMEQLKPFLKAFTRFTDGLAPKAKEFGEKFGKGMREGASVLYATFSEPSLLVSPLVAMLSAGMRQVGNVFLASMQTTMQVMASPGFFKAIGDGFLGLANIIGGYFAKSFTGVAARFRAEMEDALSWVPVPMGGTGESLLHALDPKQFPKPPTVQERTEAIKKTVSGDADASIKEGEGQIRSATAKLTQSFLAGVKSFKIEDHFGAGAEWDKFLTAYKKLVERGAKLMEKEEQATTQTKADAPRKFGSINAGAGGLQSSGGIQGTTLMTHALGIISDGFADATSLHGSARTTSLIGVKERREAENKKFTALAAKGISSGREGLSARGVRRGDAARLREAKREATREKTGMDALLYIADKISTNFDTLVKTK